MITRQSIDVNDVEHLRGQHVILLNEGDHDVNLTTSNIGFYAEKRISIITSTDEGYIFAGMFYAQSTILTKEGVVSQFNRHDKKDTRYYRLMTRDELNVLTDYMFGQRKYLNNV